ncbi:MAG TPA: hypothetical protein VMX13_09740 [Sedimentisphaerales bacterium]|nr:hypothetical protein [Sedimentisphaerales bacterium]
MAPTRAKKTTARLSFGFGGPGRKKKRRAGRSTQSLMRISLITLTIIIVICVFAGLGAGFAFLDRYVKNSVPQTRKIGTLELLGVPAWVNEQLEQKIYAAARADGEDLRLDEDGARSIQNNIAARVAWLDHVRVQTTAESFRITARWRKPLAMVRSGSRKFYVDEDLVVLDYVPVAELAIVAVDGITAESKIPAVGQVWHEDDLAAAVGILARLHRMDKLVTADKPLLYEIESIDVSNFNGLQNSRAPHIVLYARDNTQIIWGAKIGTWQRYLEATDEEKLAKLYAYYREYNTLLNGVKYINLRDPQQTIPLPVDKY